MFFDKLIVLVWYMVWMMFVEAYITIVGVYILSQRNIQKFLGD